MNLATQAERIQKGYDNEAAQLRERQRAELMATHLPEQTGFSLDPSYDYQALKEWFTAEAGPKLRGMVGVRNAPITAEEIAKVVEALDNKDEVPLLVLVDRLRHSDNLLYQFVAEGIHDGMEKQRFQSARYDGDLRGTEVGMLLFYTDLLAKLWVGVNYGAPRDAIDDFGTIAAGGLSKVYKEETRKAPSTRLWFGAEDRNFQLVNERKSILFAPRLTRIFAASSNPLEPGVEVPASYSSECRLGWWNDHYEEVAQFEPEYQRLNQFMKWSTIVSWLSAENQSSCLQFLSDVSVNRKLWFETWARKRAELRYRDWDRVGFFARGTRGSTTETMAILYSKPFANYGEPDEQWVISGGVSSLGPNELKAKIVMPSELTPTTRLSLRGVALDKLSTDGRELTTVGGTKHAFTTKPGAIRAAMRIEPKADAKLRSAYGQMARADFDRTIARSDGQVIVETRAADVSLASLRITPRRNGFEVGYVSRDVELAQSIARDLSRSSDPVATLAADPHVEALFTTESGEHLVKLRGAEKWTRIAAEKAADSFSHGWQGRVADNSIGAKSYDLAWVEAAAVGREMGRGEWLRIELPATADQRPRIHIQARGPPAQAQSVAIAAGDQGLKVRVASDGTLFVHSAELPKGFGAAPEGLSKLVGRGRSAKGAGRPARSETAGGGTGGLGWQSAGGFP